MGGLAWCRWSVWGASCGMIFRIINHYYLVFTHLFSFLPLHLTTGFVQNLIRSYVACEL